MPSLFFLTGWYKIYMKCLNGWKKSLDVVTGGIAMNAGMGRKAKGATAAADAAEVDA
jgi:hypothetical protein